MVRSIKLRLFSIRMKIFFDKRHDILHGLQPIKKPLRDGPGGVKVKTLSIYFVTQRVIENFEMEDSLSPIPANCSTRAGIAIFSNDNIAGNSSQRMNIRRLMYDGYKSFI